MIEYYIMMKVLDITDVVVSKKLYTKSEVDSYLDSFTVRDKCSMVGHDIFFRHRNGKQGLYKFARFTR